MEQTQVTALGGHISGYILSKKRFFTKINMLIFYVLQYDKKQCRVKQDAYTLGLGPTSRL